MMIRLRTPSIRYETGFSVAAVRNQSISIRFRGISIDEMKRKTKRTGNRPWTASPEPVRSASEDAERAEAERDEEREDEQHERSPATPAAKRTPTDEADGEVDDGLDAAQRQRRRRAGRPAGATPRIGVSASRLRKPVWMSRARSVPAFIVAKSAPWMNGTASAKARTSRSGSPGRCVADCRPLEFTASRSSGKTSGDDDVRRLARVRTTERRAS